MQAIAAEFGLSETAFPLPPTAPEADYRLRIFTPARELPFAGHPSVGAAWVLARDRVIGTGEVVQECGAGLLPVTVDAYGAQVAGGPPEVGPDLDGAALAARARAWPPPISTRRCRPGSPRPGCRSRSCRCARTRWPARSPDPAALRGCSPRAGRAGRGRLRPRGLAGAPADVRPGGRGGRGSGDRVGRGRARRVPDRPRAARRRRADRVHRRPGRGDRPAVPARGAGARGGRRRRRAPRCTARWPRWRAASWSPLPAPRARRLGEKPIT